MSVGWRTRIIHSAVSAPAGISVACTTPVYRGSTTSLFESSKSVTDDWDQTRAQATATALLRNPDHLRVGGAHCGSRERQARCFITPGGQAAIALIYLSFARAKAGTSCCPTAYTVQAGSFPSACLPALGIETEYYDPLIGAGIGQLLRKNTQLIWCESPGSVTMEVQDIPAICAAARAANVPVALDNTYAAGVLFDAFGHGVDITMQALTKYIGGHSDVLLGSVTVRDAAHYQLIGDAQQLLGMAVSPDDCSLALRGLQTLAVRLAQHESSALLVARWSQRRSRRSTECCIRPSRAARVINIGLATSPDRRASSRVVFRPECRSKRSSISSIGSSCSRSDIAGEASTAWRCHFSRCADGNTRPMAISFDST